MHSTGKRLAALGLLAVLAGCAGESGKDEYKTQEKDKTVAAPKMKGHDYGPGPHEGRMTDLGQDHRYVAELTFTADPRAITVYVLDHHDTTKPLPIEATEMTFELHGEDGGEQEIQLMADPLEGEEDGKSSRFSAKGDVVPEHVTGLDHIEGHLHAEFGGKEREAAFDHDEDEGHDHDE